jgi:hypothetical protein
MNHRRASTAGTVAVLITAAFFLTGCPRNQYIVELTPRGPGVERTLTFYRADGIDTNTGAPNYVAFPDHEMSLITSQYTAAGRTNQGLRYSFHGVFTNQLPNDVGGTGQYAGYSNSLGQAGLYLERFRGDDDLAGLAERRFRVANELTDLTIGWSQAELGKEPGYDRLRSFLDTNFRRDLKNLAAYLWEAQFAGAFNTNATEELVMRFGLYLAEHGYFSVGDLPGLYRDLSEDKSSGLPRRIQRMVAERMGISGSAPIPPALAFLKDEASIEKSFTNFLASTQAYRKKLADWEKEPKSKPDAQPPAPSEVVSDLIENVIEFDLFGSKDHLKVRLNLPSRPVHTNGHWDEEHRQVTWDTEIEERTNSSHFPFACYATWACPNEGFQARHFGSVVFQGDELAQYSLWRASLDVQRGREWDAFLAKLEPGPGLTNRFESFRFADEPAGSGTNNARLAPNWPRN